MGDDTVSTKNGRIVLVNRRGEDVMGKIRDLMVRQLKLRGYSPLTLKVYIGHITAFVRFNRANKRIRVNGHPLINMLYVMFAMQGLWFNYCM